MDGFDADQRTLFQNQAQHLQLERGDVLLRRGEPGGDLYLVHAGRLEVVDSRTQPETVLASIEPGTVVGEMSFVDGSPRSVDVRVAEPATVLRWSHRELRALLRQNPRLAAQFYERIAMLASGRIRRLNTTGANAGSIDSEATTETDLALADAEALSISLKSSLLSIDTDLRADPSDRLARTSLAATLQELPARLTQLFNRWPNAEARSTIARHLRHELHPYLVRSTLADRVLRRPQGVTSSPEVLSVVLVDQDSGEGPLGRILDRWLLDRPTPNALRHLQDVMLGATGRSFPTHRNRRILILNAGTGSLVARIGAMTDLAPTRIFVMDPSRAALSLLDTDVAPMHENVTIEAIQHSLMELAGGRIRLPLPSVDLVVIHGLVEYLPDRMVVELLRVCGRSLSSDGRVLLGTLGPSEDQVLFDRLLDWPTLRRSASDYERLFGAAGFHDVVSESTTSPALVQSAAFRAR